MQFLVPSIFKKINNFKPNKLISTKQTSGRGTCIFFAPAPEIFLLSPAQNLTRGLIWTNELEVVDAVIKHTLPLGQHPETKLALL